MPQGGQTCFLSEDSDLFRQELALPSPSFFVFAARIEIPGERCDQLSESAHAGSVRKIAGSRQQVLPITPDSPLRGSVVDRCIARCHLDGYQGRVLVLATPPHRNVYLGEGRSDQATHKHRDATSSDFWCDIVRLINVGSSDRIPQDRQMPMI